MSNVPPSPPETTAGASPAGASPAGKRRKIPGLVWVILIWGIGSWILWTMMMQPEIPPLEEGLLALAPTAAVDLGADAPTDAPTDTWTRAYLARLADGEQKFADPTHRDAHRVLCIREALRANRLDMACATARSIESPAKRDEVLSDLVPRVSRDCQGLPLAVWSALALHGKEAKIPLHKLLNERWDQCPRRE